MKCGSSDICIHDMKCWLTLSKSDHDILTRPRIKADERRIAQTCANEHTKRQVDLGSWKDIHLWSLQDSVLIYRFYGILVSELCKWRDRARDKYWVINNYCTHRRKSVSCCCKQTVCCTYQDHILTLHSCDRKNSLGHRLQQNIVLLRKLNFIIYQRYA